MTPATLEKTQINWQRHLFSLAISAWFALVSVYLINLVIHTSEFCDQSWYLYAAQRVLSGIQLYGPQLVETNPPLIIWFSTIPVFLAHLLHLDPYSALKLIVVALIGGSVVWSGRILRASGMVSSPVLFYLCLGSLLTAEIYLFPYALGQREHLLIILLLPYVISAIAPGTSRLAVAELCAIGVAGGIAICFKPQQVLILAALEIFLAIWTRSLRRLASPELICAVLTIFGYIAVVRLAAPLYLGTIVPILNNTYWAYGPCSTWYLIKTAPLFDFLFLATIAIFVLGIRKLRFAIASGAFLASTLAATIAFYSQHISLGSYRDYPQHAFLLLAIFSITADLLSPALLASWKFDSTFAVGLSILVLLLVPLTISSHGGADSKEANASSPTAILKSYPPKTPVLALSPDIADGFPVVLQHHLVWASRFPHLWMLPAIIQNEVAEHGGPVPRKVVPREAVARLAAMQRIDTAADLRNWKPEVVVVRNCTKQNPCYAMEGLTFDPLAWFLRSPDFATEWANYRSRKRYHDFDVYTRIR